MFKKISEYSIDNLSIELRKYYDKNVAHFIISNIKENQYIEPFENWSKIPLWYYNAFSFGGAIKLSTHNFIYYFSGFMNMIVSNNISSNSYSNVLWWYEILDTGDYYANKLAKELNYNQLKTIALFLCYDFETKLIDLSPPLKDDDSIFATFWYSFLK